MVTRGFQVESDFLFLVCFKTRWLGRWVVWLRVGVWCRCQVYGNKMRRFQEFGRYASRRTVEVYFINLGGGTFKNFVWACVRSFERLLDGSYSQEDVCAGTQVLEEEGTFFVTVRDGYRFDLTHVLAEFLEKYLWVRCEVVVETELTWYT